MERKYIKKLVGDNVYLSPISLEDVEEYTYMVNNLEMAVGLGAPAYANVMDIEKETELLKDLINRQHFAVRRLEDNELIGNIGFNNLNELHRTAVVGVMLANEKYQHKGYGTEALNLLLDYGFSILNLKNISLNVFEYNEVAYNLYKKVGFRETGRIRKAVELLGERYDVILMDILPEEYESKYIKKQLEKRHKLK